MTWCQGRSGIYVVLGAIVWATLAAACGGDGAKTDAAPRTDTSPTTAPDTAVIPEIDTAPIATDDAEPPVPPEDAASPDAGAAEEAGALPDAGGGDDVGGPDVIGPDTRPHGPLVAHWPLDEGAGLTTADLSGNNNPGTLNGGATWGTTMLPPIHFTNPAALVLDGVDDFVELGVGAIPACEAPKTVSVWFRVDVASTAVGRKNVVALTNLDLATGVQIGLHDGRVAAWIPGDPLVLIAAPAAAPVGWHHVAYTFEGSGHHLYLDGQLVGDATKVLPAGPILNARLGTFAFSLEFFGGAIDDVRIYDRVLDAAGLTALAAGNAP
jgi:hypothetical protein